MKRTVVSLAAVVAVAATAQPTVAKPARHARPVLRAVTTVTATTSGYVDVVVPRDATLSPAAERNPDVRISGAGRFVALWLTRHSEDPAEYDTLIAYRLPGFAGGGTNVYGTTTPAPTCTHFPNDQLPLHTDCDSPAPEAILLRAGHYRLTVVTDNAPVTIGLRLRGLERGRAAVRPARRLATAQQGLPQRELVGERLVTFGDVMHVERPSHVYVVARATSPAGGMVREQSVCERAAGDSARPLAFAPPCFDGYGGSYRADVDVAGQQRFLWGGYVSTAGADARSFGIGGSFGDSGGVRFDGALAVAVQAY